MLRISIPCEVEDFKKELQADQFYYWTKNIFFKGLKRRDMSRLFFR